MSLYLTYNLTWSGSDIISRFSTDKSMKTIKGSVLATCNCHNFPSYIMDYWLWESQNLCRTKLRLSYCSFMTKSKKSKTEILFCSCLSIVDLARRKSFVGFACLLNRFPVIMAITVWAKLMVMNSLSNFEILLHFETTFHISILLDQFLISNHSEQIWRHPFKRVNLDLASCIPEIRLWVWPPVKELKWTKNRLTFVEKCRRCAFEL